MIKKNTKSKKIIFFLHGFSSTKTIFVDLYKYFNECIIISADIPGLV